MSDLADTAHARTSDPWTSHAAARSITEEKLRESQRAVLLLFRVQGAMHHERMVEMYDTYRAAERIATGWPQQSESGLRTRTKELRDAGFVEDTGRTVRLASGRQSKVWQAVDLT